MCITTSILKTGRFVFTLPSVHNFQEPNTFLQAGLKEISLKYFMVFARNQCCVSCSPETEYNRILSSILLKVQFLIIIHFVYSGVNKGSILRPRTR